MILLVVALVVLLVSVVILLVDSLRRPATGDGSPEEVVWARRRGLELTPASRPWVATYLQTGRTLRRVGGFGGLVVAAAVNAATGLDLHVSGLVWILIGYLVGCLWAELALARVPAGARRAASLQTRRLADYLPPHIRLAELALPALAVGLGLVAWGTTAGAPGALPTSSPSGFSFGSPDTSDAVLRSGAIAAAVLAPLLMAAVWGAQRYLVRRPQPLLTPDLVAADDALRASSAHLLGASGLAAVCLLIAAQLGYFLAIAPGAWSWIPGLGLLAAFVGAYLIFRRWRNAPWPVPRDRRGADGEMPPPGGWMAPAAAPARAGPPAPPGWSALAEAPAAVAVAATTPEPASTGWAVRRSPVPVAMALLVLVALTGWGLRTWGPLNPAVTVYVSGAGDAGMGSAGTATGRRSTSLTVSNESRSDIELLSVTAAGVAPVAPPTVTRFDPDGVGTRAMDTLPLAVPAGEQVIVDIELPAPVDACLGGAATHVPLEDVTIRYRTDWGRDVVRTIRGQALTTTSCLAPLPTGPPPSNPQAAEAEIRASFTTVYSPTADGPTREALIDDPRGVAATTEAALAGPYGETVGTTTATVGEVSFDRPDHAWVRYELSVGLGPRTGELFLVDGWWKVARATVCADLQLAGTSCPPVPR